MSNIKLLVVTSCFRICLNMNAAPKLVSKSCRQIVPPRYADTSSCNDWRKKGVITPVQDQTAMRIFRYGTIEWNWALTGNSLVDLTRTWMTIALNLLV